MNLLVVRESIDDFLKRVRPAAISRIRRAQYSDIISAVDFTAIPGAIENDDR